MNFSQRVVALRKQCGFTQQTLSDAIDIHVQQVKRYEAGSSLPTADALKRLAIVLHVTSDFLLFDLDCNPQIVAEALGPLAAARPGLRLPGCVDPFEQGIRAILGQLVSVAMAAKLAAKVAAQFGEPLADAPGYLCFPRPEQLANADPLALKALGMPLRRAESIIYFARAALSGELPLRQPEDIAQGMRALQRFPGIGRWTASYYALRGWQAKDVFLPDDYLIKQRFAGMTPAQTGRYAERWLPWRSYALLHIWYSDGWQPEGI